MYCLFYTVGKRKHWAYDPVCPRLTTKQNNQLIAGQSKYTYYISESLSPSFNIWLSNQLFQNCVQPLIIFQQ